MTDRTIIVPPGMRTIHEDYGYAPAVRVGNMLYCAGQVGRTPDLQVIAEPTLQFEACWANLGMVLAAAGCGFGDVVELVTYHVDLPLHFDAFKAVKNRLFPRGHATWTAIGVSALARPGLLVEIKATALVPEGARP